MSDLTPFLQNLRDRLSITDVIRSHVKLVRKGREYTGLCPFHKEKSPSFTVSDEKGFYHCFGCGAHGDIFDFIMSKQNIPFMEAVELLANLVGLEVPKRRSDLSAPSSQPKPDAKLYEIMEAACCWYQQQLSLTQGTFARSYLKQRGLLPQTIAQFRLGYAPEHGLQAALQQQGFSEALMMEAGLISRSEGRSTTYDRFRNRLMFPIWDAKGRVIAFGGRILKEGEPKYLNSPDTPTFHKGKTLYAYHWALSAARQQDPFVIVEGYMDVIAMHQAGLKSAVAPLGTALTPEQIKLLWKGSENPILCFDGDTAGTRAAHRAVHRSLSVLKVGRTLQFCFLPSGEDPDSLLQSGQINKFRQVLKNPQPLVDVLWSTFMKGRSFSTPEHKAMARRDLEDLVKEITDPDVRHFYKEELRNRLFTVTNPKKGTINRSRMEGNQQHTFSSSALVSRAPPNKNLLGYKILLATLLNHPTLIEDIAESLSLLSDHIGKYDELRQAMLSIIAENPNLPAQKLQGLLNERGLASLLGEVLTSQVYSYAPFAKQTATREEALIGWEEVWRRTVAKPHLVAEASRSAEAVREKFDQETWGCFMERSRLTLKN